MYYSTNTGKYRWLVDFIKGNQVILRENSEMQEICGSVISQAKAGNMQAAKIILDRLLSPIKDKPIRIDLPKMITSNDLLRAVECVISAVG